SLFQCSHCRRETVYHRQALKAGSSLNCVWCQKPLSPPPRMKIGSQVVMLSPDAKLYPHHFGSTADFAAPVAMLGPHPSKPNTWGLKNLSARTWSYAGQDGQARDVQPGQSAPIREGLCLNFGPVEGAVKA